MPDNLNKNLDEVLEKLHYLELVIKNLKDREGTLITNLEEIDERLFDEIADYGMLTAELKKDFLMLLMKDAESLALSCVRNNSNFDKISEEFGKMEELLDSVSENEEENIKKSVELQQLASESKGNLRDIRKGMEEKVRENQEERREYKRVQDTQHRIK